MARPLRVVIATRIFTPEAAAAAFRLRALASALVQEGCEVTVLTSRPAGAPARETLDGAHVRRAPTLRGADGYIRGYLQYLSFDLPLLWRLLTVPRPDVIVSEPPPTTGSATRLVSGLRHLPRTYYAADVWSDAARSSGMPAVVVRLLALAESFAVGGHARVIAINAGVRERVEALGARDVAVVPNGIDCSVFTPQATAPDLPTWPYVIYAGTASEWQGAPVFVEALREVRARRPDLHLVFMGLGSDLERIREMSREDDHVHVLGPRPPAEAAAWQARAEAALVSIIPGRGYDFAWPTKILSALACGTPVVFAGVGPARRDIEDNGLGATADHDPHRVADALLRLLDAPPAPEHLRGWVLAHRSTEATGRAAARVVMDAAAGPSRRERSGN